ncbi:hypothetical protein OHB12_32180 [Nocardia sp. NBC_01730]|nr:hypothetical protein OHB12_32180 [Nocardia sp. NBC_01730]
MELSLTQFDTLDGVYQAPGEPQEDASDGVTHGCSPTTSNPPASGSRIPA